MTEQQIQKKIITLLQCDKYDAYVVKVMAASKRGVPDILCCIDGTFVGIEVKKPDTRHNVSKLQIYNLNEIERAGGKSLVAWSVEMVEEFIDSEVLA